MTDLIVDVQQGKLQGKTGTDIRGNTYYSFQGIPYAKPPIGPLRFKAPQKPEPWTGVRDATKQGNECYQRHLVTKQMIGSEDCLNLNVYTPNLPGSDNKGLKPVMVWIHGGGFETGSNKTDIYGPEFLLPEDIVLVTINYRLGALGFLALEDPSLDVPGNAALKDMVMALIWVKDNIKQFNGDPNNVTIFGESAGGAATHLLMVSPLAKGLFHKVIVQSASCSNIWALGTKCVKSFAKEVGCSSTNEKDILKFLQEAPLDKLFEAQQTVSGNATFCPSRPSSLKVVVEHPSVKDAFLPDNPLTLIKTGNYNKVPLLIGFTNKEGYVFDILAKDQQHLDLLLTDFETSVPHTLGIPVGSNLSKEIGEKIKQYYFKKNQPTEEEDMATFYNLVSDNCFVRDMLRSIKHHVKSSSQPVYLYKMTVETSLNMMKIIFRINKPGVAHGDDLGYLFKNIVTPEITPDSKEDISQRRFTRLWANFARYGNPTPSEEKPLIPVKWQPVSSDEFQYLEIGEELRMGKNPMEPEKMAFWEDIFSKSPLYSKL